MKAPAKTLPVAAAQHTEQVDARMLALMRCVLAFSALVIIWIDPSEPRRLVALTYASLAACCLYSAVITFVAWRASWPAPGRLAHWANVFSTSS